MTTQLPQMSQVIDPGKYGNSTRFTYTATPEEMRQMKQDLKELGFKYKGLQLDAEDRLRLAEKIPEVVGLANEYHFGYDSELIHNLAEKSRGHGVSGHSTEHAKQEHQERRHPLRELAQAIFHGNDRHGLHNAENAEAPHRGFRNKGLSRE